MPKVRNPKTVAVKQKQSNEKPFQPIPEKTVVNDIKNLKSSLILSRFGSLSLKNRKARFLEFRKLGEIDGEIQIQNPTLQKLSMLLNSAKNTQSLMLDFTGCDQDIDAGFQKICFSLRKMTALKHIVLNFGSASYSRNLMTDHRLLRLCSALKALSSLQTLALDFTWCKNVTDKGLSKLSQTLRTLVSLKRIEIKLERCSNITNFDVRCLAKAFGHLNSFQDLRLHLDECHKITNAGLQLLGDALRKLNSLQIIDLSFKSQKFTDAGIENFSKGLENLGHLRKISLRFHHLKEITGKFGRSLRKRLESLISLQQMDLEFDWCENLANDVLSEISSSFKKLSVLQSLTLNFSNCPNATSKKKAMILGESIESLKHLKTLELDFTFTPFCQYLKELGKGVCLMKNLQNFTIKLNDQIDDDDIKNLSNILEKLTSLKTLNIHFIECTYITDKGMKHLSDGLQKLKSLENFTLLIDDLLEMSHGITDAGIKHLNKLFKTMKTLKKLHLEIEGRKEIGEEGLIDLFEGLENKRSLQSLRIDLSHLEISDNGMEALTNTLKTLTSLKNLSLEFSSCEEIGEEGIDHLITGFKNLLGLESIELNLYNCSGVNFSHFGDFMDAFMALKSLKTLTLKFPEDEIDYDEKYYAFKALNTHPCLKHFHFNHFE